MDTKAFRSLSYGLYIISAQSGDERAGCVVNTFQQVTSKPARVSVTVNKENRTASVIAASRRYTASVLAQSAPMELIGTFGFHTSTEIDKFADVQLAVDGAGVPYVTEHACAAFSAHVIETIDAGTHLIFVGEVDEAWVLSGEPPMTYAYYHQVKGGKTPPKASSFEPESVVESDAAPENDAAAPAEPQVFWRCTICGHIEYVDELPDDFECPICGQGKDCFERVEQGCA